MSGDTDTQPKTIDRYTIDGELGRGSMGVVYKGWDPRLRRHVAIKAIKVFIPDDLDEKELRARFEHEAQAMGQVGSHPNIVQVYDYLETDEQYIVMELVEGVSLQKRIQEPVTLYEQLHIMENVLQGLQYIHDRSIVHRDIKPSNIMLTKSKDVKIMDFGIARVESSTLTLAGNAIGTWLYMAPEVLIGGPANQVSDIYACGVLFYVLLTGKPPYTAKSEGALFHQIQNVEPAPPSSVSKAAPAFDAVIAKAMHKDPRSRYQSANEFLKALQVAKSRIQISGDGDATVVMGAPAQPAPELRSPPWFAGIPDYALSAMALALVAGLATYYLTPPVPPPAVVATVTPPAAMAPTASVEVPAPPERVTVTAPATVPAPETPVAPVAPPPVATLKAADSKEAIASLVGEPSCSLLYGEFSPPNQAWISGVMSGTDNTDDRRIVLDNLWLTGGVSAIEDHPSPTRCDWLRALQPFAQGFGRTPSGVRVTAIPDGAGFAARTPYRLQIELPEPRLGSQVLVVLVTHDDATQQDIAMTIATAGVTPEAKNVHKFMAVYPPVAKQIPSVAFGDKAGNLNDKFVGWAYAPGSVPDLLVVLVSDCALARPMVQGETEEPADRYLQRLQRQLGAAPNDTGSAQGCAAANHVQAGVTAIPGLGGQR